MNKGFTLIELLAVIIILAIIAAITVPIVIGTIEKSKIKSLELSTSEYIRAVNLSLMNEETNGNIPNGLYMIIDDGKKIKYKDIEIDIGYDGNGLKSGLLLVENSKVTRVLKGIISDYYARVNEDEVTIHKNLNESVLIDGPTFNVRVKELVGDKNINTETGEEKPVTYTTVDTKVLNIVFLQDKVLPFDITKETLTSLPSVDVSQSNDGSIKAYYEEDTGSIYVYSDYYISCPKNIRLMFRDFQGVEKIELNLIDTSNVTDMFEVFFNCKAMKNIDLIGVNTSSLLSTCRMFMGCSNLEYLDLSSFDTSNVTVLGDWNGGMFMGCKNLKKIKGIEDFDTSNVTSFGGMFNDCNSLINLDLSKWDMRKATNASSWNGKFFRNCTNLKSVKFGENFTLENVTDYSDFFRGCSSLLELDVSMFNTSKVTAMNGMFMGCKNLKDIKGVENFDTTNVTNMAWMFYECENLTSLDLKNYNTSKVVSMRDMFYDCKSLTNLNLTSFDTSNVTEFSYYQVGMFGNCSSLEELDLRSFDTSKNTNYINETFSRCTNLKKVIVTKGKWTFDKTLLKDTQASDYTYV